MVEQNMPCPCWGQVTQNLDGKKIFKEECGRCFFTPKSPGGLNVCLTTFKCYCQAPEHDHTAVNYMLTGNPIYCNIKMIKKPEVEGQQKEITKLAIGKPGGIDLEADRYDTVTAV